MAASCQAANWKLQPDLLVIFAIEQLHKQLHYVRLIGMCGKCPIATIQIISAFDYTATTDGQTVKPLQYGNRLS